jgi:hypothetical protein
MADNLPQATDSRPSRPRGLNSDRASTLKENDRCDIPVQFPPGAKPADQAMRRISEPSAAAGGEHRAGGGHHPAIGEHLGQQRETKP